MTRYTVFYARNIPPLRWPPATPNVFVASDYLEVGTFDAPTIGAVYSLLQDPDGPFQTLCAEARIHTTMTMGDVVRDESGALWMCAFEGWYQMEQEDQHPVTEEDK